MSDEKRVAQAFIELRAGDPEAGSALAIARADLAAGEGLQSLRRFRVFEVRGTERSEGEVSELLHRSTQFYNPSKERCVVRASAADPAPVSGEETLVLVTDRGGERRPAAERWWKHETGEKVEVREGVAWALRFAPGLEPEPLAADLAVATDRRHGLLCNPHAQDWKPGRIEGAEGVPPLGWLTLKAPRTRRTR